jgi:hypothetical protein
MAVRRYTPKKSANAILEALKFKIWQVQSRPSPYEGVTK